MLLRYIIISKNDSNKMDWPGYNKIGCKSFSNNYIFFYET